MPEQSTVNNCQKSLPRTPCKRPSILRKRTRNSQPPQSSSTCITDDENQYVPTMPPLKLISIKDNVINNSTTNETTTFQKDFGSQCTLEDGDYNNDIDFYVIEDDESGDDATYYQLEDIDLPDNELISQTLKRNKRKRKILVQQCNKCSIKMVDKTTQCNFVPIIKKRIRYWQQKIKDQNMMIKRLKQILSDNIRLSSLPLIRMPITKADLDNLQRHAEFCNDKLNFPRRRQLSD